MSIDFRTDLHASGPRLDADQPGSRPAATAAGERIRLRMNGGMRSPAGIFGGAADRVLPGGWHA
jgi:hypothetical protein